MVGFFGVNDVSSKPVLERKDPIRAKRTVLF